MENDYSYIYELKGCVSPTSLCSGVIVFTGRSWNINKITEIYTLISRVRDYPEVEIVINPESARLEFSYVKENVLKIINMLESSKLI